MKQPDIKKIQERIANTSIGPSTLRNQGAPKVAEEARKFLSELPLMELKNITKEEFESWLNNKTEKLRYQLPEGAKNWGTARKALNIFLEEAFYNRFLAEYFGLDKLEAFLGLPLDSYTFEGLKGDKDGNKIDYNFPQWPWPRIRYISSIQSEALQNYALELASFKSKARIYLDLDYWPKSKKRKQG